MRITLTHDVTYALWIFRHGANAVNPRTRANLGTMVSWFDTAPGDRRPAASMREWYDATLRQRNICGWARVAPSNMVSRDQVRVGFTENAQIGWVYCTWSKARRWFKLI